MELRTTKTNTVYVLTDYLNTYLHFSVYLNVTIMKNYKYLILGDEVGDVECLLVICGNHKVPENICIHKVFQ